MPQLETWSRRASLCLRFFWVQTWTLCQLPISEKLTPGVDSTISGKAFGLWKSFSWGVGVSEGDLVGTWGYESSRCTPMSHMCYAKLLGQASLPYTLIIHYIRDTTKLSLWFKVKHVKVKKTEIFWRSSSLMGIPNSRLKIKEGMHALTLFLFLFLF